MINDQEINPGRISRKRSSFLSLEFKESVGIDSCLFNYFCFGQIFNPGYLASHYFNTFGGISGSVAAGTKIRGVSFQENFFNWGISYQGLDLGGIGNVSVDADKKPQGQNFLEQFFTAGNAVENSGRIPTVVLAKMIENIERVFAGFAVVNN